MPQVALPATILLGALGLASGATAGAFGATLALRHAQGLQAVAGRSRCDACAKPLAFAETVPVISYLALGGRCRACGGRIDAFHLWGEAGGAVLLALIFVARPFPLCLLEGALAAVLGWLALVDLKTHTLPNLLVATVAVTAAALAWLNDTLWLNLALAITMLLVFGGAALGLQRLRGRTVLGMGDVKLIGALALWLGADMPLALVAASVLGLVQIGLGRGRDRVIAFGPPLMAGSLFIGLVVMPQFRLLEL